MNDKIDVTSYVVTSGKYSETLHTVHTMLADAQSLCLRVGAHDVYKELGDVGLTVLMNMREVKPYEK